MGNSFYIAEDFVLTGTIQCAELNFLHFNFFSLIDRNNGVVMTNLTRKEQNSSEGFSVMPSAATPLLMSDDKLSSLI